MGRRVQFLIACSLLAATGLAVGSTAVAPQEAGAQPVPAGAVRAGGKLTAFRSDAELLAFLRENRTRRRSMDMASPAPPPAAPMAESNAASPVVTTGARVASDKITNTQEAGVDEGGIVKKRGDLLVILRRGRLFTVSIAGGGARPIDQIDAFPPAVSGQGDWYDEMLIAGDRVIVIGYSYARGGTEVNRFRLTPDGRLSFEDAYHLRSNDYYSSRNYASRLIGNRLVYYTPLHLGWDEANPFANLPGVSRWRPGGREPDFRRVIRPEDIYMPPRRGSDRDVPLDTLHTVMDCDLAAPVMDCRATGVIGPASRTFYVSPSAVYLWVSDSNHWRSGERGHASSMLFRMPLDWRESPSAIAARGNPTDQFSFREDPRTGLVDVLLRANGGGDWMFNPEAGGGEVALLSVPIAWMGDGRREVPRERYRFLPDPGDNAWNFQNRFVGNHVLYGGGQFSDGRPALLTAVRLRGGPIVQLPLSHAIERLDQVGDDGIAIGSGRNALSFTAVDLRAAEARLGDRFTFPAAEQGESRSHAFFFRADNADGSNGLLGLPIARRVGPEWQRFFGSAASILYLGREQRRFRLAGRLDADPRGTVDDNCQASCVDWYGNARPIFVGERVFALLGYELVEGRLDRNGRIREVGRTNFSPGWRRGPRSRWPGQEPPIP